MRNPAGLVSILAATAVISGCSSAAPSTSPAPASSTSPAAHSCLVGVSWDRKDGRWGAWDEPAIQKAVGDAGGRYVATDAKSSPATQATDIQGLIDQGAGVLIVLASDEDAITPIVSSAVARGIPVIAYDRLIDTPKSLYMSFDNVEVGRMQARALFKAVPKGNYAFIKGDKGDPNSDFLRSGQEDVLHAAIASGAIKNIAETYTDGWSADLAMTEVERLLPNNKVDAVLAENDGMASGVIAALTDHHLVGSAAISGEDGNPDALNQVALGTQTVDVWKDARALGSAAGEAAMELCHGTSADKVRGVSAFTTPSGNTVSSVLIKPVSITRDNLDVVVDAGWITREDLCKGVVPGSGAACP